MALHSFVIQALRCPSCHEPVRLSEVEARCDGGHRFPVNGGVPVLISRAKSLFGGSELAPGSQRVLGRFSPKLPSLTRNASADGNLATVRRLVLDAPGRGEDLMRHVLNVGGGDGGVGAKELGHPLLHVTNTDVQPGASTDLVADAHDIPFDDGVFDAVIVQAVMEHVLDPNRCAAEIRRVLRPGGYIYAETPFMQQVHMGAYDFTRFTALGHRRLWRHFEELDSGVSAGAGSALAWACAYFVAAWARTPRQRRLLLALSRCLFFVFKFFDSLQPKVAALDGASAVYFLGRLTDSVLSDRDLVLQYAGLAQ